MSKVNSELLEGAVSGEVLKPGDEGFDEARALWNVRFDRQPAAIAPCHSAKDVRGAVRFARNEGFTPSVKGGGHAYAANTVAEGGVLIDLSPMKGLAIDPLKKTARVGPGVKWGEFDQASQAHGLATTGGTVSTIGVSGFTLGGGTGYLVRKHGLAIDNLLSAEVVTADGEMVTASEDENVDLFWAIRGGGGNFGVATSFEFRLHEVGPQVLAGQIMHRFEDAGRLLPAYREFMANAPEEIQCYAFILRVPPIDDFPEALHGHLALDFVLFHLNPDAQEELQPLMELGDPFLSLVGPQPYTAVQQSFDAGLPSGQRYESRAHYLAGLSDGAIEAITSHAPGLVGPFSVAYLEPLGGAAGRVDPAATAFAHRDAAYSFHILGGWMDAAQDDEVQSWVKEFYGAMAPYSTGGVYVNLLGSGEHERVQAAYGDNYRRLAALKKKWDPENLLQVNHNIPPAD
jgi:FAD/FMN-containing dehydrogenase